MASSRPTAMFLPPQVGCQRDQAHCGETRRFVSALRTPSKRSLDSFLRGAGASGTSARLRVRAWTARRGAAAPVAVVGGEIGATRIAPAAKAEAVAPRQSRCRPEGARSSTSRPESRRSHCRHHPRRRRAEAAAEQSGRRKKRRRIGSFGRTGTMADRRAARKRKRTRTAERSAAAAGARGSRTRGQQVGVRCALDTSGARRSPGGGRHPAVRMQRY
mmetsp:Transcript_65983/g.183807  ORF Transcript_65983/g.183807 Transcript_65983/m.183807 type:complete len:217 (-) Transcript_65983:26-676(-)